MRRNVTDFDRQDVEAFNGAGSDGGPATPTITSRCKGREASAKAWSPASSPNSSAIAARKSTAWIPIR